MLIFAGTASAYECTVRVTLESNGKEQKIQYQRDFGTLMWGNKQVCIDQSNAIIHYWTSQGKTVLRCKTYNAKTNNYDSKNLIWTWNSSDLF